MSTSVLERDDTKLLDTVHEEVSNIKEANNLTSDQTPKYTPEAWTRQGWAD